MNTNCSAPFHLWGGGLEQMYRDQEQREFARGLRNQAMPAERHLWHFLKAEQLGVKFRRQAAIGPYVVDFVCFTHGLVVELDGPQHLENEAQARDAHRTAWLESQGFRVLRFRNYELDEDVRGVVEVIKCALRECDSRSPSPTIPTSGGCLSNNTM